MSHSYNKIWLHVIFSTKERMPLIKPSVESKIHAHMKEQLESCGCILGIINGIHDHVHLLFLQNPKVAVTDVIKQVKANTSYWINEQNLIPEKFSWQTGYAAYVVSESQQSKVFRYIKNQKEHHKTKPFMQEYNEFISIHGLINENERETAIL